MDAMYNPVENAIIAFLRQNLADLVEGHSPLLQITADQARFLASQEITMVGMFLAKSDDELKELPWPSPDTCSAVIEAKSQIREYLDTYGLDIAALLGRLETGQNPPEG